MAGPDLDEPYMTIDVHEQFAREYRAKYMNEWRLPSKELYDFAAECCRVYDRRCDLEQRNFSKIAKEEIDNQLVRAIEMGWDHDGRAWRKFCFDSRDNWAPYERN